MFIQTETTPNPDAIKFIPGPAVAPGGSYDFRDAAAAERSPLAQRPFKIVGVNGHIFATPIDRPLDDYDSVAARLSKIPGIKLAIPLVEGQALASSQTGNNGVLVRGVREADIKAIPFIGGNIRGGTLDGFDTTPGVAIGRRLANALGIQVGDNMTLVSPQGASTPFGTAPRACPERPTRWISVASARGAPTWQTRSTTPTSMPSSSEAVATTTGTSPALSRDSASSRARRDMLPWCAATRPAPRRFSS